MSTSGTRQFTLTVQQVIDEATERLGGEPVLGRELVSARRSLNLLITNLINAGVLFFTLQNYVVTCSTSQASYTLPTSSVDVLEVALRQVSNNLDIGLPRVTFADYLRIPNKGQTGRPMQYMIDRRVSGPVIYLWQVPSDSTSYQLNILAERRIEDITASNQDIGVPFRFMPVLSSGLAYYLGMKRIGIGGDRIAALQAQFNQELTLAKREDRDRSDYQVSPRLRPI